MATLTSRGRKMLPGLHRGRKAAYLRIDGRIAAGSFYTVKSVKAAVAGSAHAKISACTFEGAPVPALTAVLLERTNRGFVVEGHHYPQATAKASSWYRAISADDRLTVDAWLGIWERKAVQ